MDEVGIRVWFDEYLNTLAARGRGEADDVDALLEYYAVPLVVATDNSAQALTAAEDVLDFARQQVEGMRAADYDHTETLDSEVTTLNLTSVLYRASFERRRADATAIGRLALTYLITRGPAGLRIAALAIHTA